MFKYLLAFALVLAGIQLFSQSSTSCTDTSYSLRLSSARQEMIITDQESLGDTVRLICGRVSTSLNPYIQDALVLKASARGDIVWSKVLHHSDSIIVLFDNIKTLKDGGFLATGKFCNRNESCTTERLLVARFNPDGVLLWVHAYSMALIDESNVLVRPQQIAEDEEGNIYFTCNLIPIGYSIVAKLSEDGTLLWSTGIKYRLEFGRFELSLTGLFSEGSSITSLATISNGFGSVKFDKETGAVLSASKNDVPNNLPFTPTDRQAKLTALKLNNGRYLLVTAIDNSGWPAVGLGTQLQLIEYNADFSIYRSCYVKALPGYNTLRDFAVKTSGEMAVFFYTTSTGGHYSLIDYPGKVKRQKKINLSQFNFTQLNASVIGIGADNFSLTLPYLNSSTHTSGFERLEMNGAYSFKSSCFSEKDTAFITLEDFPLTPSSVTFDRVDQHALKELPFEMISEDLPFIREEVCKEYSVCDRLKINGPDSFCVYSHVQQFTASRGNNCLRRVIWRIDSAAVQSITNINDTTISVRFKKEWNGYLYAALEGCSLKDSIKISVYEGFAKKLLIEDTSFCSGDSITLTASESYESYKWSTGSKESFITVRSAGKYAVAAYLPNGCYAMDTVNIQPLLPLPSFKLMSGNFLCYASNDTLSPGEGYSSYLWQDGSTGSKMIVTKPGNFFVSVVDENGCKGSDTALVKKIDNPPSKFIDPQAFVCPGGSTRLSPSKAYNSYLWSGGSTLPYLEIKGAGDYSLTVTDEKGCRATEIVHVSEEECRNTLLFPTAFTPNGDGRNDIFKPQISGRLQSYSLEIFNRWGQLVFKTNNPSLGWSGKYGVKTQSTEIFVFVSNYQFEGSTSKAQKGTVMLIR